MVLTNDAINNIIVSNKSGGDVMDLDECNDWFLLNYVNKIVRLNSLLMNPRMYTDEKKTFIQLSWNGIQFALQFSKSVPNHEVNESSLAVLTDSFIASLEELYPVLEERRIYMDASGNELPSECLVSLHNLWNDFGTNGFDSNCSSYRSFEHSANAYGELWNLVVEEWDVIETFTAFEMEAMRDMYLGAAVSHSKQSMLNAFLTRGATLTGTGADGVSAYALNGTRWVMDISVDHQGVICGLGYLGQAPSSDFEIASCSEDNGALEFNWPDSDQESLRLTWEEMQQAFDISQVMFMSRFDAVGDPLAALKACCVPPGVNQMLVEMRV